MSRWPMVVIGTQQSHLMHVQSARGSMASAMKAHNEA